jgi:hypothetical protein
MKAVFLVEKFFHYQMIAVSKVRNITGITYGHNEPRNLSHIMGIKGTRQSKEDKRRQLRKIVSCVSLLLFTLDYHTLDFVVFPTITL